MSNKTMKRQNEILKLYNKTARRNGFKNKQDFMIELLHFFEINLWHRDIKIIDQKIILTSKIKFTQPRGSDAIIIDVFDNLEIEKLEEI